MAPLPNTTVIPAGFVAHHAATVRGGMTATVRMSRPGVLGSRNATSGVTPPGTATQWYEGVARAQSRGGSTPADAADRLVKVGNYLVALPGGAGTPKLNDLALVLTCPSDPRLVGLTLIVVDVPLASIVLQINLGCDLQSPANP